MPEPYICPTPCDTDCEINGWGCHEAHHIPSHREHDPGACEARMLAGNLRWLVDDGMEVEFGCYPDPREKLERYYVRAGRREDSLRYVFHGVNPGDAIAKAWYARIQVHPAHLPDHGTAENAP